MQLTIIFSDGAVYKNGVCYSGLTWEGSPSNIHALQWQETTGWLEFNDGSENQTIDTLPNWVDNALASWETASLPVPPEPPTAEQLEKQAAKESALTKLTALGLTTDEVNALLGTV